MIAIREGEQGFAGSDDEVPYANAVGSVMYAMVSTRPDLAFGVGLVSRFMSNPSKEHWAAVQRTLRYLMGTQGVDLVFKKNSEKFSVEVIKTLEVIMIAEDLQQSFCSELEATQ